ncbi:MAG: universal stress protein [Dehalococcoidia bacterium]|nr:universal stress protein [Dehalococcoidia bacterium]
MKILIALDGSDIGETAVSAIGAWSHSSPIDLDLLLVVHPDDIGEQLENSIPGEFIEPADTEPGHIPVIGFSQYGDSDTISGDPMPKTVEYRGQALARARSEREDYLHSVASHLLPDRPSTVHVEFSEEAAETIVEAARTLGVDAIAMATHGRTGIRHVLMGSVAEEVVRRSPLPVVLIGPQVHTTS